MVTGPVAREQEGHTVLDGLVALVGAGLLGGQGQGAVWEGPVEQGGLVAVVDLDRLQVMVLDELGEFRDKLHSCGGVCRSLFSTDLDLPDAMSLLPSLDEAPGGSGGVVRTVELLGNLFILLECYGTGNRDTISTGLDKPVIQTAV